MRRGRPRRGLTAYASRAGLSAALSVQWAALTPGDAPLLCGACGARHGHRWPLSRLDEMRVCGHRLLRPPHANRPILKLLRILGNLLSAIERRVAPLPPISYLPILMTGDVAKGRRNYGDHDKGLAPLSLCESR
jgi:hypothetical protein